MPSGSSRQKISELAPSHAALKAKNDARAFALLRAIAAMQLAPSPEITEYPTLRKLLDERAIRSANSK